MPIPESPQPAAFKAFEHERWQSVARAYHDALTPLTSQYAPLLLDAAGVGAGSAHLDLASGPGEIPARAAERGARTLGTDFSSEMVALARANHPGIEYRVADAESLDFADDSFDAITMSFLIGHLGRPAAAVGQTFRVLRPGGRFALSWWSPPDRAKGFSIVMEAVKAHGNLDVPLPPAPPFDLFGDPAKLRELLEEAGYRDVEIVESPTVWHLPDADALFDAYLNATARTSGLLRAQAPQALVAIRDAVRQGCVPWATGRGLEVPMPARVVSGRKP